LAAVLALTRKATADGSRKNHESAIYVFSGQAIFKEEMVGGKCVELAKAEAASSKFQLSLAL